MATHEFAAARQVVLAGGGHAHALLLRQWGGEPMPGVSLTLVSPDPQTPYSGMLPGLIAGHYTVGDMHIDLEALCQRAGARFIQSRAVGIDGNNHRLELANGQWLDFDALSLDTGAAPSTRVPGVAEHAIGIKPIAGFWRRWRALQEDLRSDSGARQVAVVGGGAGAVEAVLAMAWACRQDPAITVKPQFHLVFQEDDILPGYPTRVRRIAVKSCRDRGIGLHPGFRVSAVHADHLAGDAGQHRPADVVLWCTGAAAPQWPADAGLACNAQGFVKVNPGLQSPSHPRIFAAGDLAHMMETPRPKAGVFAVRQAPYLFANIRRFLRNQPLASYRPQDKFLSLLTLGERRAVGSRGSLVFHGRWVWYWKDYIDRRFMGQFKMPSR